MNETEKLARRVRLHVLEMLSSGGGSHIGSCFSIVDILAVLYSKILVHSPQNPKMASRDRFILSKGHAGAAMYAVLAESGYSPLDKLKTHYQDGSDLSGHVSHHNVPGVEVSTGSLGHGLSIAAGMSYATKLHGDSQRVFALLSDGECDEGSTWEAIMFSAHHKLDNLVAIVDYNKIQSLGTVSEVLELEPFTAKWRSFGWSVREVDGHNHTALYETLKSLPFEKAMPACVIAHTIKGKGVSFMENNLLWHYRVPKGEEYEAAKKELADRL